MQRWEYFRLHSGEDLGSPYGMSFWPSSVVDSAWLVEQFGVRVREGEDYPYIDKFGKQGPSIAEALLKRLGLEGWEAIQFSGGYVYFKRPVIGDALQ